LIGTDRFFAETPGLGSAFLAGYSTGDRGWNGGHKNNGRPGYAWYYGRDAEWTCFAVDDYGDFDLVKEQLKFFRKHQDMSGKIFHELSTSGVVHYDAADATPLYIILAAHYLRASGDVEFIRESWPYIQKAMDFLYSTDTDGDGAGDLCDCAPSDATNPAAATVSNSIVAGRAGTTVDLAWDDEGLTGEYLVYLAGIIRIGGIACIL
jgi:glycogen debranching enzyme